MQTKVDTSRVSFGEMISAAAGGLLVIAMLLPWFSFDVEVSRLMALDRNAWQALGFIDVVVFFAAMAVIALAVVRAVEPELLGELPWPPAHVALGAGALALALIVFRLISPPELAFGDFTGFEIATSREIGIFLAFGASLGMLAGGWLQLRESTPEP